MKSDSFIHRLISYSQLAMAVSLIGFVMSILVSYPYADNFSIPVQILAHISTIVFAGIFKVGVVALMASAKEKKAKITISSNMEKNYATT